MQDDNVILVIDDEEAVREAVTDILDLEGWPVLTAESGEVGIDLYRTHQAEVALVILDLSMPGLSGQETLVQLQAVNPEVKVLLSSGYSEVEVSGRFARLGVAGFLQKPYNALRLIKTVQQHLTKD
ncbi:MAG: response regulator [Chloroflexota bacterium]|nr:response regulator [Anaerolineales bacterium]MCA9978777.1 response regulator [Anaerolineales bacterium]MCB8965461.1 response regulator [Ardenticatenaceae bacterium]